MSINIEAAYLEYRPGVWRLLRRLVQRVDAAVIDDLTSETFLHAVRGAATYHASRGAARAWICTIAAHVAIDYLRHQRIVSMTDLHEWSATTSDAGSERHVAAIDIETAVATLPEQQQRLVVGHYRDGLARDVAGGCASSSAWRHHQSALASLRARLEVQP